MLQECRQSSSTNMRQMAAAAAAKAAAAAAAASGVYEDAVIPAVTKARYADQDMCYINRRRPSRKYSSHQTMDTCSGGEGQLPPALSVGKQMSILPDASSQVSRYVSLHGTCFKKGACMFQKGKHLQCHQQRHCMIFEFFPHFLNTVSGSTIRC